MTMSPAVIPSIPGIEGIAFIICDSSPSLAIPTRMSTNEEISPSTAARGFIRSRNDSLSVRARGTIKARNATLPISASRLVNKIARAMELGIDDAPSDSSSPDGVDDTADKDPGEKDLPTGATNKGEGILPAPAVPFTEKLKLP
jgi:hypothetical protein